MLITEITMDRLHKYLAELEWANLIIQHDLKWTLILGTPSIHREREREREREEREREKQTEREKDRMKKLLLLNGLCAAMNFFIAAWTMSWVSWLNIGAGTLNLTILIVEAWFND